MEILIKAGLEARTLGRWRDCEADQRQARTTPVITDRKSGMHQLRHYYASVTLAGGVNVKELANYLGHSDPGFTLRIYAHMLPSSHDRARAAINARMFKPRAVPHGAATEQTS